MNKSDYVTKLDTTIYRNYWQQIKRTIAISAFSM